MKKEIPAEIAWQFLKSLNHAAAHKHMHDPIYEPMQGGGSAATLYRLQIGKEYYVLRLFPPQASPLTRRHQMMLAGQAGELGFGPKVHFVDSQMHGMVMDFIPGRTVEEADFAEADKLAAFALVLQRLHGSMAQFPLATSPFQRFRDFYSKIETNKALLPPRLAEAKAFMEEVEAFSAIFKPASAFSP